MASFGEALVSAFNQTYGTISTARLRDAQARAINDETDAAQRQRDDVRAAQIRNGILNPDGTTNDPGATPRAPAAPTAVSAPTAAPAPDLGAPTSPGLAAAGTGQAPTPPAAPATGAPAASPPPQAAPRGALQGAVAPTPPPAASPAPQATPQAAAQPAAQGAGGIQNNAPGMVNANQPLVPAEVVQRAAAEVDRLPEAERPVAAMVVAGAMAPQPQQVPGQRRAAEYAPQLVQEVLQNRGEGESGPLTRANWNAYLRDVTLAAQRNLSPRDQVQALAVVDRIRTAGLQRFTALAVAAAQAGDMQGAANALNGASNFNPDGFQDTFRATQGGVEMVRRPEPGVQGQETRVTVPAAEVVRYATSMLDPTWSLNHFLQVRRQNEEERSNRAREGLTAAGIAESRAARAERRAERREEMQGDAAYARATAALGEAERALDRLPSSATAEQRRDAEAAVEAARTRRNEALQGASARGVAIGDRIENNRRSDEDRDAQRRDRNAGRERLSAERLREFTEAERDFVERHTARGGAIDPAASFARAHARAAAEINPNVSPGVIMDTLRAFRQNPGQFQVNPNVPGVIRTPEGLTLRLPESIRPAPPRDTGGRSSDPPAPRDEGTSRGGLQGSMQGARSPAPAPPVPAPELGRAGASTAPLPAVRSLPNRSDEALESAVRAMRTPAGRRQGVEGVARAYGVDVEELRARVR